MKTLFVSPNESLEYLDGATLGNLALTEIYSGDPAGFAQDVAAGFPLGRAWAKTNGRRPDEVRGVVAFVLALDDGHTDPDVVLLRLGAATGRASAELRSLQCRISARHFQAVLERSEEGTGGRSRLRERLRRAWARGVQQTAPRMVTVLEHELRHHLAAVRGEVAVGLALATERRLVTRHLELLGREAPAVARAALAVPPRGDGPVTEPWLRRRIALVRAEPPSSAPEVP